MEKWIPRMMELPANSCFLFGPRGTGKSSWLKKHYPDALVLDLLDANTFRVLSAKPERLSELIAGNSHKKVIIIDEVQKLPALLDMVHKMIEENRIQFILTGSSARKLKKTGADLLAGRALVRHMHPFVAAELKGDFNLDKALQSGLLPLAFFHENPLDFLKSYISLYIREEVMMEGLTRNIGGFSRFLEAVSFSHGSVMNITNISRDCQVERKTVEGYISILEDLLLGIRVPVFEKRARRATVKHPKFYLFDAGVFRALRPAGPLDRPSEIDGAALEGLVCQHLMAWCDSMVEDHRLYYWQTKSGTEVDFIIYGNRSFLAIEVKNAGRVDRTDIKALRAFREDYPEAEALLVYRGSERLVIDGILCIPCVEFLPNIVPGCKLSFPEKQ